MIIDEWDMLVRDVDEKTQKKYVNFLRSMFKSNTADDVFLLVYMTGILPIIKTETQSALNNFDEFSVIRPVKTAQYYGFTKSEVETLCKKHDLLIVYGATITPFKESFYYTPEKEQLRQNVNNWIRTCGLFDAVIDLETAICSKDDPFIMDSTTTLRRL